MYRRVLLQLLVPNLAVCESTLTEMQLLLFAFVWVSVIYQLHTIHKRMGIPDLSLTSKIDPPPKFHFRLFARNCHGNFSNLYSFDTQCLCIKLINMPIFIQKIKVNLRQKHLIFYTMVGLFSPSFPYFSLFLIE